MFITILGKGTTTLPRGIAQSKKNPTYFLVFFLYLKSKVQGRINPRPPSLYLDAPSVGSFE